MNIATLQYSTFHESFFERAVTKTLSIPSISGIFRNFFYNRVISLYANLYLEFSGFQEYIHEMDKEVAKNFVVRFTKIHKTMLSLQKNISRTNGNQDFTEIIDNIVSKISENIELLEDVINPHYSYQISANYKDNDWNDPLNDHWDNY
jgi:CRISPR/Cas system CMR subunit Cmr6 (Cas7 group RAMP superfamily)